MQKKLLLYETLKCIFVSIISILIIVIISNKDGYVTRISDGFAVAGILILFSWVFKYIRLIGGVYGYEVFKQFNRENKKQDQEKLEQQHLKNMYQYKTSPKGSLNYITISWGIICIIISIIMH